MLLLILSLNLCSPLDLGGHPCGAGPRDLCSSIIQKLSPFSPYGTRPLQGLLGSVDLWMFFWPMSLTLGNSHGWGQLCIYDPKCEYWPGIATRIKPHMCNREKGHRHEACYILEMISHWSHHNKRLTHFFTCYVVFLSSKKSFLCNLQ